MGGRGTRGLLVFNFGRGVVGKGGGEPSMSNPERPRGREEEIE